MTDTCTEFTLRLADEAATERLGAALASCIRPALKIYLSGDLGTGKTTLVRALLRAMGIAGRVRSPTFTLLETYNLSRLYLYHFDFYRLNDPHEWDDAGFRDIFAGEGVCLVEWPERVGAVLPPPDLRIALSHLDDGRVAHLIALSPAGRDCLQSIEQRPTQ